MKKLKKLRLFQVHSHIQCTSLAMHMALDKDPETTFSTKQHTCWRSGLICTFT